MKKLIITATIALACVLLAVAETMWDKELTPVTTSIATESSTNVAGTAVSLPGGVSRIGLWVKAQGGADGTNGSLVVKFSIYNGTTWTDANDSSVKITMSTLGNATRTAFDWFEVPGATQIRVGQIENTFDGAVSNMTMRVTAVGP